MPGQYTIGTLAKEAGVNVETIRYYQRRGLVAEPDRPPGGIRRYAPVHAQRLRFIKQGFRLLTSTPQAITAIIVQNGVIHLDGFPSAQDENGELRRHWKSRDAALEQRRRDYTRNLAFPTAPAGSSVRP